MSDKQKLENEKNSDMSLDIPYPTEELMTVKSYRKSYRILKLVGILQLLSILYLFLTWAYIDMKNSPSAHRNRTKKYPIMVWHTNDLWWARCNRKVLCTDHFGKIECDVILQEYHPEDVDAYLFYSGYVKTFPLPRHPKTLWAVMLDESPINRLQFMYEKALNLFNVSASFSRYSDVPMPLIWLSGYDELVASTYYVNTSMKNALLSKLKIAPVLYIQSNCDTATERDVYVKEIMKYIEVDSYGACLNNKNLPLQVEFNHLNGTDGYLSLLFDSEIFKFIARYKFMIAIENAVCNDYMSEKLWRVIEAGVVPIYYGSPLIRDWLPNNKSAILLEDFPTPELLSQHLHYLLNNDTAYEEYLEHKIHKRVTNQKLINELTARPHEVDLSGVVEELECLVCSKLHRNMSNVNMVTKKHYDCPIPTSALTLSVNPKNGWIKRLTEDKERVEQLYQEIGQSDLTPRESRTSW
ncbi:alpha-(1,3)-fucosyltransferase B-like [Pectinophora gossypiella]|uniref:alpha-(1,3)-fucosyltransferase B-like n=1 Tax=Pectinophora gossypiella TaxID=13191 RepID=UPI00214E853C|nr:alpha-(1,3)-fucosyltransferase B-like [Pectinophora gossypiella]XP_049884228.1 alpha-(1,3)-fucosyltransferase B-like [Pectinophora gossypiella]XP_049884229.1 alpha-(1,3)-fucosyltransferase B-like [Pectinophora gossypiella]